MLVCMGGRGDIDDAAAAMMAQVLEVQGAVATPVRHGMLEQGQIGNLDLQEVDTVVIAFLNDKSLVHARHGVRRLKRLKRGLRVGLFMPRLNGDDSDVAAEVLGADFLAHDMTEAVRATLADTKPVPLPAAPKRKGRPVSRRRAA